MTLLAARHLWSAGALPEWHRALAAYPEVLAAQGVEGLDRADAWYRSALPTALAARAPTPYLTRDELEGVIRWKMKRGEWRARNLALARGNDASVVERTTREAFAAVPHERAPIDVIATLAGVGPATASAVLAALRPDVYPFLEDVVGETIEELGPPRFATPYYLRYARALRQRAESLGPPWTAQRVSDALWAARGGKSGADR